MPLILTFLLLRPGFKRVYDERKTMFSLFVRIPKKYVSQLSKMRTDLSTASAADKSNKDLLTDDDYDDEENEMENDNTEDEKTDQKQIENDETDEVDTKKEKKKKLHANFNKYMVDNNDEDLGIYKKPSMCKSVFPTPLILVLWAIIMLIIVTFVCDIFLIKYTNEASKDIRVSSVFFFYMHILLCYLFYYQISGFRTKNFLCCENSIPNPRDNFSSRGRFEN